MALGALALSQVSFGYALTSTTSGQFGQSVTNYFNSGASTYSGYTGAQLLTFTAGGGGTPTGYPTTFVGYCVDLENAFVNPQDVLLKSTSNLTKNGISPNSGNKVAWLYNKFASTVTTNVQGAALQVAIWEALYDSTADLSTGFYRIDGSQTAVLTQANAYLSAMNSQYTPGSTATWFDATPVGQDVIGPAAIPEPGLMSLLAGTGMSGLILLRRRARK
jgi:hypothetical protein